MNFLEGKPVFILGLAALLLVFFVQFFFFSNEESENDQVDLEKITLSNDEVGEIDLSKNHKKAIEEKKNASKRKLSSLNKFSYQDEVERVRELGAQFPGSRKSLLKIITENDPYKVQGVEVKTHSLSEIKQNQRGAVKVLALRELMMNQKDLPTLRGDLSLIIRSSKDPVIRRIAKAAQESLDKGRSFFDDFTNGVARLPQPAN